MSRAIRPTPQSVRCPDCGESIELQVYRSEAGYYIGRWCGCGPYSRESLYFATESAASQKLEDLRAGP